MPFFEDKKTTGLLTAIVGLALLIRLVHLWFLSSTAFPRTPLHCTQTDMFAFWQWAQAILAGDWLGQDTYHPHFEWMQKLAPAETWYAWWGGKEIYHQAPLYPYLLAAVLAVKNAPTFAIGVQLILGISQPLIMFFLARRLFDDRRVAWVSAALTAFYGPFVFYQGLLLRDWLPPILEPLVVLMVIRVKERRSTGDMIATGLIIGLGILSKETTLAVSTIALLWLLMQYRPAWRAAVRPLGLIALGTALCLSPLIARNVAVGAPPLAVSVQGAGNVVLGFAPSMSATTFEGASQEASDIATRGDGKFLGTLSEILKTYGQLGYANLIAHEWVKVRGLLDPFELANNASYYYGREISPVLTMTIGYGVVFPLAVTGFLLLLRQWRKQTLLYSFLFASAAAQMVTFTAARFRLALVPVLILGASFAVVYVMAALKHRRRVQLATAAMTIGILALLQHFVIPFAHTSIRHQDYVCAAITYRSEGRYAETLAEIEALRTKGGGSIPPALLVMEAETHLLWAYQLLSEGNREAALREVQVGEEYYARMDDLTLPLYNLGLLHARLGNTDKAAQYLRRFLDLGLPVPESKAARRILSLLPQ